ncbi:ABC-type transport auxiliary lipoprotein family protein [Marinobacter nauticus]|uniref:ABC-type transport auxiliary lipoprotein family protein n=1 Tax=Marinobacter nauticus TaxID=2743 RepID=UPI001CD3EFA8|nr:ABC-type transport auxiliary lipoprotein family protein [Marinobacter nauticus]MCA0911596.1 ABC-type transport auxiliary lipoprotein family protein [Marinobacter nauticus]
MKVVFALALSLILAGCTVFPVPESPRLMELAPASDLPAFGQALPASLRVDTPLASDPLGSTRILIKPSAYEYRALAGARWRESIPVVVRDHLLETFRASGAFANVMTDTSPATSQLTLVSELTGFQAENGENGTRVVVRLHLQLLDNRTRQSLCVKDFEMTSHTASTTLEDLVKTFSAVANDAASATVQWAYNCRVDR